jgi:hypothetical protein
MAAGRCAAGGPDGLKSDADAQTVQDQGKIRRGARQEQAQQASNSRTSGIERARLAQEQNLNPCG